MLRGLIVVLFCFFLAMLLVRVYRQFALQKNIVDVPNHRSSHTTDTVRGAGIVILLVYATVVVESLLAGIGSIGFLFLVPVFIGVVGLLDDIYDLRIVLRLAAYSLGLLAALFIAVILLDDKQFDADSLWSIAVCVMLFVAGLWLVNLYNFMDGINGIAACEAIFIFLSMLLLAPGEAVTPLLLAGVGATAGFLVWNFPRARVFMGDSGSTMLGALVFCASLYFWLAGALHWASLVILPAVFVADASYVLVYRLASGQQWYSAHRSHSYQILARRWDSHTRVVAAVMLVNVGWLLPLAWLASTTYVQPGLTLVLAYLPLVLMGVALGAGRRESP